MILKSVLNNLHGAIYVITLLTLPLHLNPPLYLPIPPHLSLSLPVSHLNNSKSVLQYNIHTMCAIYLLLKYVHSM